MAAYAPPSGGLTLSATSAAVSAAGSSAAANTAGPPLVSRTVAPITRPGLHLLVTTVRQVADRLPIGCQDRVVIEGMISGLPLGEVPDTRSPPAAAAGATGQAPESNSPRPKMKCECCASDPTVLSLSLCIDD